MENEERILRELGAQSEQLDRIEAQGNDNRREIARLKGKASFWGALTGAFTAIIFGAFGCGCSGLPGQSYPEQRDLRAATVALVSQDDADTYCAGVHLGQGVILTAAHCVTDDFGLEELVVYVQGVEEDGTLASHAASVDRVDVTQDLAVLGIQDGYRPREELELASAVPYIQEPVWACGHPWGLTYSITRGEVVSQRRLEGAMLWIQVDIAVDPGNSGGPLVNSDGQLVGITSFKMGRVSGFCHLDSIREILQ